MESHTHTQAIIGPPDRRRTLRGFLRKPGSLPRQVVSVDRDGEVSQARPNSCAPDRPKSLLPPRVAMPRRGDARPLYASSAPSFEFRAKRGITVLDDMSGRASRVMPLPRAAAYTPRL